MLRASTPVESFCDVVRMVGMVFSLSWNSRKSLFAQRAIVRRDPLAIIRVRAGFKLVDEVAHEQARGPDWRRTPASSRAGQSAP